VVDGGAPGARAQLAGSAEIPEWEKKAGEAFDEK
jgi:hypothetical protein